MQDQAISRRSFVRRAAAGASGLLCASTCGTFASLSDPLRIDTPFHGAVLNRRMGRKVPGGLEIQVSGEAPAQDRVTVNGVPASRDGQRFTAKILVRHKETDITAVSEGAFGHRQHAVRVVWDKHSQPRYRFSIDDNIYFLRDIYRNQHASLFDCFYLKMLRDLHTQYGARFVLNLFYRSEDGFNLSQFPDRYRGEWADNAHWLKLAFHADREKPDRPYQNASPEKLAADFDMVAEQILRFAGKATYVPPSVVHWAMVPPDSLKVLRQRGVRVLSGFFFHPKEGWDINYLLDDDRSEYLSRHDALMDFRSGILFSKVDLICNGTHVPDIAPLLSSTAADPNQAEVMDLFTHEQYFWPFYSHYLPDHAQRLHAALRWVTEHGYKPVFFHEGLLGGAE